ncbi:uncharacterized protein SOCEGT47_016850 [Sorangium cellulosum]|uniref:PIN domain-containing protein n=1 Tax=Sorangium cellulosum TaxID=56 RepID=A0A4P2PXD9_SORCE|nr:hypothetical protein [Sorangium cellulosum]AUX21206.1 uncharacterized protein SOCEGT47_016850 [Sorangium cellulosum]
MRVYAESNFVLEIVLEQEQHLACEELINLALGGSIELAVPAFATLEPHGTIVRREVEGDRLRKELALRMREVQRTASMAADASRLRDASELLIRAEHNASKRFLEVRARLLDAARIIALDGAALRAAAALVDEFGLKLPDAVMLASVLADATARPSPSLFLNRNTKDFYDPGIVARLGETRCEFVGSFDGGLARVRKMLETTSAG